MVELLLDTPFLYVQQYKYNVNLKFKYFISRPIFGLDTYIIGSTIFSHWVVYYVSRFGLKLFYFIYFKLDVWHYKLRVYLTFFFFINIYIKENLKLKIDMH